MKYDKNNPTKWIKLMEIVYILTFTLLIYIISFCILMTTIIK